MIKYCYAALVAVLPYQHLSTQPDSLMAAILDGKGTEHYRARTYDSAVLYYRQSLDLYNALGNIDKQAEAHLKLGNTYYRMQKPRIAIESFLKSEKLYSSIYPSDEFKLHRPYMGLSASYQLLGQATEHRNFQEKAHELILAHYGPDHFRTAISYSNLGLAAADFGEYDEALFYYHQALPKLVEETPEGHTRISGLLVNMGIVYSKLNDFEHAIEYYNRAIDMDLKLGGEQNWALAYNYLDLAQVYIRTGRDSIASDYLSKSIPIAQANDLHEVRATCFYELGRLAEKAENDTAALNRYLQAIDLIESKLSIEHHALAHFMQSLSDLYLKQRQFEAAELYIDRAIQILRKTFGDRHPRLGEVFNQKAKLEMAQADYDQALRSIDVGIEAQSSTLLKDAAQGGVMSTLSPPTLLRLLVTKADLLQKKYLIDGQTSHLHQALAIYEEMATLMDGMRREFMNEDSKIFFQNEAVKVYDRAIQVCHQLYGISGQVEFLNKGFTFCERNKAVLLAESLYADAITEVADVPPELLAKEKDLQQKLQKERIHIIENQDDSIAKINYAYTSGQYDSLMFTLKSSFPFYFDLKYGQLPISLSTVQNQLDPEEALISFFQGDSLWSIFYLLHDGAGIKQISRTSVDSLLIEFRSMVSQPAIPFSQGLAYTLCTLLIPEFLLERDQLQHLIVVPDGLIGHIPLEALSTQKNGNVKAGFLLNRFAISFTNSATLHFQSRKRSRPSHLTYAGFAPSYDDVNSNLVIKEGFRDSLNTLPFAREEIVAANRLLGGITFLDREATERNFRSLDPDPTILHLAMHTWIDDEAPEKSRLLFAGDRDSSADGSLHTYEIYNTKINSELVILSACNTGHGIMHRGEGIMSISRAFGFAGCTNIIMSLWKARDQPTYLIICDFFENIKKNLSKLEALRQAKLSYLSSSDPLKAHPANWATLVMIGNHDDLVVDSADNLFTWSFVLLLVFATLMIVHRKLPLT